MKLCFAQPQTAYKVHVNLNALALSFPQLIADLNLEPHQYIIYIGNLERQDFLSFLEQHQPTHLFLTSITCNFPEAVRLARIAKSMSIITVLGGIFPSMNSEVILRQYTCFNYVVKGNPSRDLLAQVSYPPRSPRLLLHSPRYQFKKCLSEIIIGRQFQAYYGDCQVCYEITNGCVYACSFCSMRTAWGNGKLSQRNISEIQYDLQKLSHSWTKLKIIDDDFLQTYHSLQGLSIKGLFKQVIIETRIDRINPDTAKFLKQFGVTHVLLGVENFVQPFLLASGKKKNPASWESLAGRAIDLCNRNGLTARAIVMLTSPFSNLGSLESLTTKLRLWNRSNNVEVFFSFYTPHPGLSISEDQGLLLTNDLTLFDHLHLVYLPNTFSIDDIENITKIYDDLVNITESHIYNPPLVPSYNYYSQYELFFKPASGLSYLAIPRLETDTISV